MNGCSSEVDKKISLSPNRSYSYFLIQLTAQNLCNFGESYVAPYAFEFEALSHKTNINIV